MKRSKKKLDKDIREELLHCLDIPTLKIISDLDGEVSLVHTPTGSKIVFKLSGDIEMTAKRDVVVRSGRYILLNSSSPDASNS